MTVEYAAPIDQAKLDLTRRELGANFARILGYYEEDGLKSVAAVEEAARTRNAVALVRPAHTLKGESLQFGAVPLAELAERIENAARHAVEDHTFPIEVIEEAAQLRPLFDQAIAALKRHAAPPAPAAAAPVRRAIGGGFGRKVG